MKTISYTHLSTMPLAEIDNLIQIKDGFSIEVDGRTKNIIVAYLENERRFLEEKKNIRSRLAYLWRGRRAFSIIPFITLWNKTLMSGFKIDSIDEVDALFYLTFKRYDVV